MQEIWKDIEGYEGLYQVSNLGNIKSYRPNNKYFGQSEHLLKLSAINTGYYSVTLYKENKEKHKYLVHRLVAMAFIPNPKNLPYINHIDENKTNNNVNNLEWCDALYNNNYGTAIIRKIDTVSRPVNQFTLNRKHIASYKSSKIASELLGINRANIQQACHNHTVSGGYFWEYDDAD